MIKFLRSICLLAATFVSFSLPGIGALASENADPPTQAEEAFSGDTSEQVEEMDEAQLQESFPAKAAETHTVIDVLAGYRFLTIDNYGGRAAKYTYLHSGVMGGASYNRLGQDLKLSVDGNYLNDKDYYGDVNFDYAGDYRFHLRTESLFHNTTGENLFSSFFELPRADCPSPALANSPECKAAYIPHQDASTTGFGVRTEQDTASLRYKIHDFPLHINIGYWRMVKEGTGQIRFADVAFEGAENNFFARSKTIDRETHEGKIGFDTHLGPIDIIYTFLVRQFTNNAGQLRDVYASRNDLSGASVKVGGLQEHNEDPDSRYVAHTVKLHTSLAGGLVGAASYTYGKRDNLSGLTDTAGADHTSARLNNMAGDLVYMPFQELSFGFRYRRQEVDNNNPSTVTNSFFTENPLAVRPSIGTEKDIILASVSYHPINTVTLKGEYKGEFLHRDLTHFNDETLNWFLDENEDTHRGVVSVIARPVKGLRMMARYAYTSTDHPSYGSSFARKHEGELTSSYNVSGRTGFTASYRNIWEENDEIRRRTITALSPLDYSLFQPLLARSKITHNFTASAWIRPSQKLTITANYGYLQYDTDQVVMFQMFRDGSLAASNYKSASHLYSLSSTYQFTEKADISLTLQEVHSLSEFRPENKTFSTGSDTIGISELSHSKTFETSFSARGNYRISKNLSCSLEYMLQDYHDKFNSRFDGTVNSVTAFLSARW